MSASADISKFLAGLAKAREKKLKAAALALTQGGAMVVGQAQNLTPVKTGALQASGTWEDAKVSSDSVNVVIGFNTNYAAAVHERLNAKHNIGQAKFLSAAMQEGAQRVFKYVADRVAEVSD